jgi:hypothetical protein
MKNFASDPMANEQFVYKSGSFAKKKKKKKKKKK